MMKHEFQNEQAQAAKLDRADCDQWKPGRDGVCDVCRRSSYCSGSCKNQENRVDRELREQLLTDTPDIAESMPALFARLPAYMRKQAQLKGRVYGRTYEKESGVADLGRTEHGTAD